MREPYGGRGSGGTSEAFHCVRDWQLAERRSRDRGGPTAERRPRCATADARRNGETASSTRLSSPPKKLIVKALLS
eukprot:403866-Prymnesium_polylepis.1